VCIDVGSNGGHKEENLATLDSVGFAREFILTQNLMPILFSARRDLKASGWRQGKNPPSVEAAVAKFTNNVRFITEDRNTGLVRVTVEWDSAQLAARWANSMVETVNERLRTEATRSADRSIEYLNKELAKKRCRRTAAGNLSPDRGPGE
jgi:hypothetical protein